MEIPPRQAEPMPTLTCGEAFPMYPRKEYWLPASQRRLEACFWLLNASAACRSTKWRRRPSRLRAMAFQFTEDCSAKSASEFGTSPRNSGIFGPPVPRYICLMAKCQKRAQSSRIQHLLQCLITWQTRNGRPTDRDHRGSPRFAMHSTVAMLHARSQRSLKNGMVCWIERTSPSTRRSWNSRPQ